MYRGRYSSRGGSRGGSRGSSRGFGARGGTRGSFRGAYHGGSNMAGRSVAGFSNVPTASAAPQHFRPRLAPGCFLPKDIFRHFNPSATSFDRDALSTINASEEKPDGAAFALIFVVSQPRWMPENLIFVKSHLELLPEYPEKKAVLLAQHQEPSDEETRERIAAKLTENIKFDQYGIEDGPDMECFDEDGNISSLLIPGEWMGESHELPEFAAVDTPSVKYRPGEHEPIAIYAGYGKEPDKTGFKFVSWFLIEEVELFAANSVDLARMMKDKSWAADMGREWAAVKLRKVKKGEPQWRPYPFINRGAGKTQGSSSEEKGPDGGVAVNPTEDIDEAVMDQDKETEAAGAETGMACPEDEEAPVQEAEATDTEHAEPQTAAVNKAAKGIEVNKEETKKNELEDRKEQDKEEVREGEADAGEVMGEKTKGEEKSESTAVAVDEQVKGMEVKEEGAKEEGVKEEETKKVVQQSEDKAGRVEEESHDALPEVVVGNEQDGKVEAKEGEQKEDKAVTEETKTEEDTVQKDEVKKEEVKEEEVEELEVKEEELEELEVKKEENAKAAEKRIM